MRRSGVCHDVAATAPGDHLGWVFDTPEELVALSRVFLAEGSARGERLLFVADADPDVMDGITDRLGHPVEVTTVADVYGPSGLVDAEQQRATFTAVLDEALAEGYSGIRVAADGTALVADPMRLDSWIDWEAVADGFMHDNPMTGLCCFDRAALGDARVRYLMGVHPLVSSRGPAPSARVFVDGDGVVIEGIVDVFAVEQARRMIRTLGSRPRLVVDPGAATLFSRRSRAELDALSDEGVQVVIQGRSDDRPTPDEPDPAADPRS